MKGRAFRWRGGFTVIDGPTLTTFHNALIAQFGFVAVGAPVFRTFGATGKLAAALYEQAMVSLWCQGDLVTIEATVRGTYNWEGLKTLAQNTFGLKSIPRADTPPDYLVVNEQEIEL